MSRIKSLYPAIAALTLTIGCAHASANKPMTEMDQKKDDSSTKQVIATAQKPPDATPQEDSAQKALAAELNNLPKVFFNFDDATLTDEGKQSLSRIADILTKNPRLSIRIEGNCDERGTEAYNLALGQKRADAAKQYLSALGAQDQQVSTITYGAERPAVQGHDEAAWRQNRRDEFVITAGAN